MRMYNVWVPERTVYIPVRVIRPNTRRLSGTVDCGYKPASSNSFEGFAL